MYIILPLESNILYIPGSSGTLFILSFRLSILVFKFSPFHMFITVVICYSIIKYFKKLTSISLILFSIKVLYVIIIIILSVFDSGV